MRCSSFCTAREYTTDSLVSYLNTHGLEPKYFDDVIYVQKEFSKNQDPVDIFFFPFGAVITWGADEMQEKAILNDFTGFEIEKITPPFSEFIYFDYDEEGGKTFINEEENKIVLGDKSSFVKLSISHALAQSAKLSALEKSVTNLLEKTSPIQKQLAQTGSVSLSKKEISKQIGQLFNEKYSINLHSDILDTPEFFWRRPSYEPLYIMTTEFQDIKLRQDIMNHRLNMIHELYTMLANELDHKHSSRLEWIIIVLIAIEILLAVSHNDFFLKFLASWI